MKTGKTFNSPGFGHWRLMGLFGGLMCLMLAGPVATTVEAQKSSSAPDFNQPSQGQSNEPPKSPQQPSPPQQPPPQTPPATPPAQPALPPAQPMPEPALPPGQQRIEQPMLPPGTPGGPLPGKEHLQLEAMTLLPPLSRDAGGLPPSAQPISDDAPADAAPGTNTDAGRVELHLEGLLQRITEPWHQSLTELEKVDFDSLNDRQLNDLFERMDRIERGISDGFKDLVNFATTNFDPMDRAHFAGPEQRFGAGPDQGERGSSNRSAPPTTMPGGTGLASQGYRNIQASGVGGWVLNVGANTTSRSSRTGNITTYAGTMPGGRFLGWDKYQRGGGRESHLHEFFENGSRSTTTSRTTRDGGATYESHSEAPNGDRKMVWHWSTAQTGVRVSTSEGTVQVGKDHGLVTKGTDAGTSTYDGNNPDITTNPGDDATASERAMAAWMWSRHNAGTTGGSQTVETGVRVNPGDRGESTGLTGAPSVADVIDVDIAGDPRERAAGQLPANHREQTEQMVRDGAGPGANPGSPDGSQLEEAAPTP